ncbi:hypothetical protein AB0A69_06850 [Streptomyces sp. NPDC045431]|uniref:hypothetical protein n=1 Tax=Streptomyces sp. NPDC045431 TaxID=3155613 RepID=UPI0033ECCA84
MVRYLAIPLVLLALLIAASGVAAVTHGWVLPTNRKAVHRPRLYGWGQLTVALALCCHTLVGLVITELGTRQWGTLTGSALLLTGLMVMMVSQRQLGRRQGNGSLSD